MRLCGFAAGALLLCATPAWADLPLTIEDLITEQGRFKLDLSLAYANAEQSGISTGQPLLVQTGPNSWVSIPTQIGERRGNTDSLVSTLGLRYGLTAKTEIYARTSHLHTRQRNSSEADFERSSHSCFADAWAGISHQFLPDAETPALLGFAEIALREKHRHSSAPGKSILLGWTTYKAIDPIVFGMVCKTCCGKWALRFWMACQAQTAAVAGLRRGFATRQAAKIRRCPRRRRFFRPSFALTAAHRLHQSRMDGGTRYRPGNALLLNPSVAFAVNDRVTLSTGVQWSSHQAERLDGQAQGLRRTKTDIILGASHGFTAQSTLSVNIKTNASGQDGADLRIHWLRQF